MRARYGLIGVAIALLVSAAFAAGVFRDSTRASSVPADPDPVVVTPVVSLSDADLPTVRSSVVEESVSGGAGGASGATGSSTAPVLPDDVVLVEVIDFGYCIPTASESCPVYPLKVYERGAASVAVDATGRVFADTPEDLAAFPFFTGGQ